MKIYFTLVSILAVSFGGSAQYVQNTLSELWTGTGGQGVLFHKNKAISAGTSSFIVGSTINGLNNSDVLIQKFDQKGVLLWQQEYAGSGNGNDVATDAVYYTTPGVGGSSNLFITGTVYDSVVQGQDLLVQKYSDAGSLLWTYKYHGSNTLVDDLGTCIFVEGSLVYVVAASATDSTEYDYLTVALNINNGSVAWMKRYDFHNLNEAPAKIQYKSGNLYVTGASQDSLTGLTWAIATVRYNATTGAYITSGRVSSNAATGVNDIADFAVDDQDNLLLVGAKYGDTTSLDIAIYKLDSILNLVWENFYDFHALDDKGAGIKLDHDGNIYLTGTSSTSSMGTEVSILKVDPDGNEIWRKDFGGLAALDDKGVNLVLNDNKLFVTAAVNDYGQTDYKLYALDTSGVLLTTSRFEGAANLNDVPQGIALDDAGNILVTGKEQTGVSTFVNKTVKYAFDEKLNSLQLDTNDVPIYVKNELIVRFDQRVVNKVLVDKKNFLVGTLEEFVDSNTVSAISAKLGIYANRLKTYKIFQRMTTADSISISRLGDTIKLNDFWATYLIAFSVDIDELVFADSLNSIADSVLFYAEPNYVGSLISVPDDQIYSNSYPTGQTGLYSTSHGVNVQNVWEKQVGQNYVKVGVYDSGVNWRHEDFGDGTWNGSKIIGGWDFYNNVHVSNQTTPDAMGHGTAVAGIIGALRNNNKGIAGIAGGDSQNGNSGVQLFSMKINQDNEQFIPYSLISVAMVEGASYNPNTGYGYGLHIQNHSWCTIASPESLRMATQACFENNCVLVAGIGNTTTFFCQTCLTYPASYNDKWALKVGGNNQAGVRSQISMYGAELDFIAPAEKELYATLDYDNNSGYTYNYDGTSFAAPHVTGVVALMCSEHNTNNGYPNNLAPEDAEEILQKYATPVTEDYYPTVQTGLSIPNQYAGYGRINASEAIDKMSLPDYYIKHAGGHANSTWSYTSNIPVTLTKMVSEVPAGNYLADRYEVINSFNDVLPVSHEAIDIWVRYSSSLGVSSSTNISGDTWFSYIPTINQNTVNVTTTSYCWWVHDVNKWIPTAPPNIKTAYSLQVRNALFASVDKLREESDFQIYPNPTNSTLTINYHPEFLLFGVVEISDAIGRIVYTTNIDPNENHTINLDFSNFASGMYLCTLKTSNFTASKFIIKN